MAQGFLKAIKLNILQWPRQPPNLKNNRANLSATEDKTEGRKARKHTATEGGCSEAYPGKKLRITVVRFQAITDHKIISSKHYI